MMIVFSILLYIFSLVIGTPIPDTKTPLNVSDDTVDGAVSSASDDSVRVDDMVFSRDLWNSMKMHGEGPRGVYGINEQGLRQVGNVKLWPNNVLKYYFDPTDQILNTFMGRLIIKAYIDELNGFLKKFTCVSLEEDSTAKFAIKIVADRGDSCSSSLGVDHGNGRHQELVLSPRCWNRRTVAHEFLHGLGFEHAHARWDREHHLQINSGNIKNSRDQIEKIHEFGFYEVDAEWDYGSIMMYRADGNGEGELTIVPKKSNEQAYVYTLGSHVVSYDDYYAINRLYQCVENPPNSGPCKNSGYLSPTTSKCICPLGYYGPTCESPMRSFLQIILPKSERTATGEWQKINVFYEAENSVNSAFLHLPHNGVRMAIVVKQIKMAPKSKCDYGCPLGFIEVKTKEISATGRRNCCTHETTTYYSYERMNVVAAYAPPGQTIEALVLFKVIEWN